MSNIKGYNSPWNVAVKFNIDMSFSAEEIQGMLVGYNGDYNLELDTNRLIDVSDKKIYEVIVCLILYRYMAIKIHMCNQLS